jgi:serine/threonine-protein kinase
MSQQARQRADASTSADDPHATGPHLGSTTPPHATHASGEALPPTEPAAGLADPGGPGRAGRYRIEGEIAHGGMGVVWRAADPELKRPLAVKALRRRYRDSPELALRLLEEAQVTAQLQHPGVPPVHEVGRLEDGSPFFAMKLVRGRTLAELLGPRRDPSEDQPRFLAVFEQVCQTVGYAHSRGVIHRDIKPSNVMVGAFGEVQVMDWGLAKILRGPERSPSAEAGVEATVRSGRAEDGAAESRAGAVLGTLAFMAPEQARGETDRLDERCDVFGLGAILCVILTGEAPYRGAAAENLADRVAAGDLADAFGRLDACGAEAELVRVAKVCLATEASARPPNAGAVASAVTAHLASVQERLRAAESGRAAAVVKAAEERKRRRLALGLAAVVLLGVVGVAAGGLWWQGERARRDKERAEQEASEAKKVTGIERDASSALQEADALAASAARLSDDPPQWKATLARALSACERAESLLRRELGQVDPALPGRARRLRRRLEADERDRRLLEEFEEVRERQSRVDPVLGRFRNEDALPRLRRAFEAYGLPVRRSAVGQVVARIRGRPAASRRQLTTALDVLRFYVRHAAPGAAGELAWLSAALDGIDPDPWRRRARVALAGPDPAELARLSRQAEADQQPAAFLHLLTLPLPDSSPDKVDLLRRAQRRHPGDFWINHDLGHALQKQANPTSDTSVLRGAKLALLTEAVGYYRAALAVRPTNPGVLVNLAAALSATGDQEGARAASLRATQVAPTYATAYTNLGTALAALGRPEEAVGAFRKAVVLAPSFPLHHFNLGRMLQQLRRTTEAVACYRRALKCDPNHGGANNNLGVALAQLGRHREAIPFYRKAIAREPGNAERYGNLGIALAELGQLKEAADAFGKAVALDPGNAGAHGSLGALLLSLGRFAEARDASRRCAELLSEKAPMRGRAEAQRQKCERLLALEAKLPAALRDDPPRGDPAELLALADLCSRYKRCYVAASRLYAAALAADARPAHDRWAHRYNAASAAALAGCGLGHDPGTAGSEQRRRWRGQALAWLRDELAVLAKQLQGVRPKQAVQARHRLRVWQSDPHLACVRERGHLARLPQTERAEWQELWAEVAALLKTGRPSARPERGPGVWAGRNVTPRQAS